MTKLKTKILSENVPYILTVILAVIAYGVKSMTDYILTCPVIEYYYENEKTQKNGDSLTRIYNLNIENLSYKKTFHHLSFTVKYETDSMPYYLLSEPELIPFAPQEILTDTKSVDSSSNGICNCYNIDNLYPKGIYKARMIIKSRVNHPHLPKVYLKTDESVWLTESNAQTFFAKYYFYLNIFLFLFFLSLLFKVIFTFIKKDIL